MELPSISNALLTGILAIVSLESSMLFDTDLTVQNSNEIQWQLGN